MISFTPALCQVTTIALPTSLSAGQDSHLLRFRATFSSRAEHEQAKRDGVRVEMWTNLDTVGGPAGGAWHAIAFDFAEDPNPVVDADVESAGNVISILSNTEFEDRRQPEAAVFLDVHVPGDLFSYLEHPRFSFTYRLVYRSGHVEWLGAFGYDGVLAFEQKDPRVIFKEDSHILTTGGGYIVESERDYATGIGKLSKDLVWERWSFAGNGPAFSRSHITSPSGCIILTPFPAPGGHSFTPEALQPMILTAGQDGASLSISDSGDITFHPGAEASYNPVGLTAVGAKMLALGRDTNVLDYDASSNTMVVSSVPAPDENQTSPIALSFVPLGPRPQGASHVDVKLDSQKLAGVFPGSDIVLYQNSPARKFKVIPTSNRKDDFVTIRVRARGYQIFVAPLHDLSVLSQTSDSSEVVRPVDVWQVAVVSPHKFAQLGSELHDVTSVFPTPPPSPPFRTSTLGNHLDVAPSIDSILATVVEEDHADEIVGIRESMSDSASTAFSPSVSADGLKDLKALLLSPSPSPSDVSTIPRYTTSQTVKAYPVWHQNKKAVVFSPAKAINALLQVNVVALVDALLGRVLGILLFVLAMFGLDLRENTRYTETTGRVEAFDLSEEDVKEQIAQPAATITTSSLEAEVKPDAVASDDEGTAIDSEDDKTPISSPPPSHSILPAPAPVLERVQKTTTRSSYLRVGLLSESSTVSLVVCSPTDSVHGKVQISVDGKASSDLSWFAVGSSTFVTDLRSDGPLSGELEISINA